MIAITRSAGLANKARKCRIHLLTAEGFEQVEYTETEHYIVARRFLHDHEAMLKTLLEA